MHGFLPLIGLFVLFGVVALVVKFVFPALGNAGISLPYEKEPLLFTPAERSFLGVLESALGDKVRIFGKVRLADVIKVKSGLSGSARQQAFNRIQGKHLDFVACDLKDLSVRCVVELDDSSHLQARRRDRDEFVDQALSAAGVPVLRLPVKRAYSARDIRTAILERLESGTEG
jgi:very-short-patch-repair endonuclease